MANANSVSAIAKITNRLLRLLKPKYFLKTLLKYPRRSLTPLKASKKFSKRYRVSYHKVEEIECLTACPLDSENGQHIVYFHGGAYIIGKNGVKGSESLISSFIEGTGAKVTFIEYPVAPESCFSETLDKLYDAYFHLCEEYENDSFVLTGESAGGSLALSFAQMIKNDSDVKQPVKLVLYSPWLDLSMENSGIKDQEKKDSILSKEALLYAAVKYAGPNNMNNPLVSPIYGDLEGLGEMLIFFGTNELFYPDGLRIHEIAEKNSYEIKVRFYSEMPHAWILMPFPESTQALQETFEFLSS